MLNLLRSDFYRLFRSKSYYICMLVSAFLVALGIIVVYLNNKMDTTTKVALPNGIDHGLSAITGNIPMFLGIIIGIYVTAEFTHGTMKNVVSKGFSKIKIYLSKYITMLAAAYIFLLFTWMIATIGATIFSGEFGAINGKYIAIIGIELLLYAGLIALLLLVAMVVKNLGGVIAINLIYILLVDQLFFLLLQLIVKNKIKFTEYSILNNILFYSNNTAVGSDYLRSAIIAVAVFVVATALGIFAFKKSDVK